MEIIPGFSLPLWSIITIISAAAALLILLIIRVYLNYSFQKKCEKAANDAEWMKKFRSNWSGDKLLRRSRLVEKTAEKCGNELISETGLDKLWEKQFLIYRRTKFLKKFIKFFPEKGLFFCILGGKSKPSFEKLYKRTSLQSSDLNLLRKIAAAGNGSDFDGEYALSLAGGNFQEIIELTGDPDWQIRFFAVKLLIYSDEKRAERAVWDAFTDSSSVIRKTVATEFKPEDTERLSEILKNLLLDDPAYSVRKAARFRLDADFPESYRVDTGSLTKPQTLHMLGLLHSESDEDENTALTFLLSEDLEIRLQAALYLQQNDVLKKLFLSAEAGDKTGYSRIEKLLTYACEVNCTDFLREVENTGNPASINLAAGLLRDNGNRRYIDMLAQRIFAGGFREQTREHYSDIYSEGVECISTRGSDKALEMLNAEMKNRRDETDALNIILPRLPLRGDTIFIPTLISFLKRGDFPDAVLLRQTIERFPPSMYIEEIIGILRTAPDQISTDVKKEAFKILGELQLPCCLQMILEHLKLLDNAEQKEFAAILKNYDEKSFIDRISGLLSSCDSAVKSSIISSLPATGLRNFIREVKESANDPDPEVRIASIWALAGYGETKLISQMTDMLRDPVARVRQETAEVIAGYGSPAAMEELAKLLTDENEVLPVKSAAIHGFGRSKRTESIRILVTALEDSELRPLSIMALTGKTSKQEIRILIELFKDAAPQLREYISDAFKAMGEDSEAPVSELLREDISSLRETLADILLKTGFIEATVAKLRHRRPEIRKNAASILAMIRTKEAFKGMVLAARDPDSEVRVEVLKALEKLNTAEGKPILEDLSNDPDRRVRKYTLWAMERIKAKNTVEPE